MSDDARVQIVALLVMAVGLCAAAYIETHEVATACAEVAP